MAPDVSLQSGDLLGLLADHFLDQVAQRSRADGPYVLADRQVTVITSLARMSDAKVQVASRPFKSTLRVQSLSDTRRIPGIPLMQTRWSRVRHVQ